MESGGERRRFRAVCGQHGLTRHGLSWPQNIGIATPLSHQFIMIVNNNILALEFIVIVIQHQCCCVGVGGVGGIIFRHGRRRRRRGGGRGASSIFRSVNHGRAKSKKVNHAVYLLTYLRTFQFVDTLREFCTRPTTCCFNSKFDDKQQI